jgi:hypothetical protein
MTRPAPSAWATTRSPASSPALRRASAGIVIWFFELIVVAPRRRFFTSVMNVRVKEDDASNKGQLILAVE